MQAAHVHGRALGNHDNRGEAASIARRFWQRGKPRTGREFARSALRASVATSPVGGILVVGTGLAGSWGLVHLIGGADHIVPHFYYLPILFAAVRFGAVAATVVALVSGYLAGPLTALDVAAQTAQDPERWVTRAVFFVGIGLVMSWLVRPSLPSVTDEVRSLAHAHRIRKAISDDEIFVRYQPIVDLRCGDLYGLEALVRWQHPVEGELGPGAFLDATERTDAILDLDEYVLTRACQQLDRWVDRARRDGFDPPCVTVNLSARDLATADLIPRVRDVLNATSVDPTLVCLEITESAFVDDIDVSVARIAGLRTLGVRVAVDDFGTGYSSLSAVHRFPIDVIKIDRAFVNDLGRRTDTRGVLGGLVLFSRSLDLVTVAEGVETDGQLAILGDIDIDLAQGYLFAPPLVAEDAMDVVAARPFRALVEQMQRQRERDVVDVGQAEQGLEQRQ